MKLNVTKEDFIRNFNGIVFEIPQIMIFKLPVHDFAQERIVKAFG